MTLPRKQSDGLTQTSPCWRSYPKTTNFGVCDGDDYFLKFSVVKLLLTHPSCPNGKSKYGISVTFT
jgi:hypothetical protein